jgi:hypothetical protein
MDPHFSTVDPFLLCLCDNYLLYITVQEDIGVWAQQVCVINGLIQSFGPNQVVFFFLANTPAAFHANGLIHLALYSRATLQQCLTLAYHTQCFIIPGLDLTNQELVEYFATCNGHTLYLECFPGHKDQLSPLAHQVQLWDNLCWEAQEWLLVRGDVLLFLDGPTYMGIGIFWRMPAEFCWRGSFAGASQN